MVDNFIEMPPSEKKMLWSIGYICHVYSIYLSNINPMLKHKFTRSQLVLCPENVSNYEKKIVTAREK